MSGERDPLEALATPEEWPWAAAQVAASGDRGALRALVAAYEIPAEVSRRPLLDAIEALEPAGAAADLARSEDSGDRRLAARLAHLAPDPAHLPTLEHLVADPDPAVAAEARAALRTQVRDPAWRAAVERLGHAEDPELRAAAAAWQREG